MHADIYLPSHIDFRRNSAHRIHGRSRCEPGSGRQRMVQRDVCVSVRCPGMGRSVAPRYARPEFAALVDGRTTPIPNIEWRREAKTKPTIPKKILLRLAARRGGLFHVMFPDRVDTRYPRRYLVLVKLQETVGDSRKCH